MLEMLKNEANITYTENGAVTNVSTGSECLDLFARIGALRSASDEDILRRLHMNITCEPRTEYHK